MDSARIVFRGWKAVLILTAILVWAVAHFLAQRNILEAAAHDVLRSWLFADYARQAMTSALKEGGGSLEKAAEQMSRENVIKGINIIESKARLTPEGEYIVRVKYDIGGNPPPDGKDVRYFVMQRILSGNWFVEYEAMAWQYYLAFF